MTKSKPSEKFDFTFWLNLFLGSAKRLSHGLNQKVKSPTVISSMWAVGNRNGHVTEMTEVGTSRKP